MGSDLIAQGIIDELEVFCPVDDCPWKVCNNLYRDLIVNFKNIMEKSSVLSITPSSKRI